jgi:hypothetical protein
LIPVPEWGDVPGWLQGAAEAGALYLAVRGRRQAQAVDWARQLKELSDLSEEELRRLVEDKPVLAEIVGRAWQAAAETASHDKRRLLAKVASAAITGDAAAQVDELQILLRTVIDLDQHHVALLVVVHQAGGSTYHLGVMWTGPPDLRDAALATLQQAGLVHQQYQLMGGLTDSWRLTAYGNRFLAFLQETGEVDPTS